MSLSTNACRFVYISKDSGKKIFDLCLDQTGDWIEDNTLCVEKAVEEFKENVKYVYSGPKHWPAAVWAELGHFIQELPYYSNAGFAYHNAGYILPPSNALSVEEVNKTALEAIAIDGTAAHQQLNMCCKLNETIIWRTVIQIESDSDKNADNQSSIWMIEMDAFTGQILEKNEYHIGSDMPIYSYCVPWSIYCLSLEQTNTLSASNGLPMRISAAQILFSQLEWCAKR